MLLGSPGVGLSNIKMEGGIRGAELIGGPKRGRGFQGSKLWSPIETQLVNPRPEILGIPVRGTTFTTDQRRSKNINAGEVLDEVTTSHLRGGTNHGSARKSACRRREGKYWAFTLKWFLVGRTGRPVKHSLGACWSEGQCGSISYRHSIWRAKGGVKLLLSDRDGDYIATWEKGIGGDPRKAKVM